MRVKIFIITIFISLLMSRSIGVSQEICNEHFNLKKDLTLKECIEIALSCHSNLIEGNYNINALKAKVREAKAGKYPKIEMNFESRLSQLMNELTGMIHKDIETNIGQIKLSKVIFDGFKTKSLYKQAESGFTIGKYKYEKIQEEVIFGVIQAYYNLLYVQKILSLKEQTLEQSKKHLELAQAKYRVGMVPKSDILKAEEDVANNEADKIYAQNRVKIANIILNSSMGIDIDQPIEIFNEDDPLKNEGSLNDLIMQAYQNRPELNQMKSEIKKSEAQLLLARSRKYPTVITSASYGLQEDKSHLAEEVWRVMLTINFPLFEGFATTANITSAYNNMEAVKARKEQLFQDVTVEVTKIFLNIIDNRKRLEVIEKTVEVSKDNLTLIEAQYGNGISTILEVIDANINLHRVLTSQAQVYYELKIEEFRILKATGTLRNLYVN